MTTGKTARVYGIDETLTLWDADGNDYRRKMRTGIKRGEVYVQRSADGVPVLILIACPTGLNLTDLKTGKPVRHPLEANDGAYSLCWTITEEAYNEGRILQSVAGTKIPEIKSIEPLVPTA